MEFKSVIAGIDPNIKTPPKGGDWLGELESTKPSKITSVSKGINIFRKWVVENRKVRNTLKQNPSSPLIALH